MMLVGLVPDDAWGQSCFQLPQEVTVRSVQSKQTFSSSMAYKPFTDLGTITGLSICGFFRKTSPEYVVRVVLKDTNSKEHLVLESYEEINSDSIVSFSRHCEETAFMDNISPDSLKVYLKDAILQIDEVLITQERNELRGTFAELKKTRRKAQVSSIIERINAYNKLNKRLWLAGETELSQQDYSIRSKITGISNDAPSGGLEYYVGGIFELGHTVDYTSLRSDDGYVDHWDWRKIQGTDWITSVKDQGNANYCTTFAVAGCLEALVNLYYNRKIDMDLSEMELVCCADSYPHLPDSSGLSINTAMQYVVNNGLCDEDSYPYAITQNPKCLSDSIIPVERVRVNRISDVYGNPKRALIQNGPQATSLSSGIFSPGHAMLLVGYGTLHENDTISCLYDYQNDQYFYPIVNPDDQRVGLTYWIYKNSWGTNSFWNTDGGYIYILDHTGSIPSLCSTFSLPLTTLNYTDNDIVVEDLDGDGYYNWGLGDKPSVCPAWIPIECDRDDSNPLKHYIDSYGNFPEIRTFPIGTEVIMNHQEISRDFQFVNDIEINHDVNLTITGSAYCLENVKVSNYGGHLIIDGGVLANTLYVPQIPSYMTIRNGGAVYMKKNADFVIPVGCTLEIEEGEICRPYNLNSTH